MKKIVILGLSTIMLLAFSGAASAENAVSNMALTNGGQHIAACAQLMDKGVSECAKTPVCEDM